MKLRKLTIERLPGLDRRLELTALHDGLNVIVGPNGIGKSRLVAAVRALLWRERDVKGGGLSASAGFDHHGAAWRVERDGSRYGWQCDGIDADPPALPGERLDACFFLGLRDLLDDSDRAGRDLASEIRRQMSGGFDLDAVAQHFAGSVPARIGNSESKALSTAEGVIRKAEQSQLEVERRERELEPLKRRADRAGDALKRLPHYDRAISLQAMRDERERHQRELAELPAALANCDGREIERLDKLTEDLERRRGAREDAEGALAQSRQAARDSRLDEPIEAAQLDAWRQRAEQLAELERQLEAAGQNAAAAREVERERRAALGRHARSDADPDGGDTDDDRADDRTDDHADHRADGHAEKRADDRTDAPASDPSHDPADAPLALDRDFDLFAFLRESQQLASQRAALQERLELLAPRDFGDDDARRLELLKRGVEPLRAWLRAPDPSARAGAALRPAHALAAAVACALVGLGFWLTSSAASPMLGVGAAAIAIGAIALLTTGLLWRRHASSAGQADWRSIAEQQFPDAVGAPQRWSVQAVTQRLRQLEGELAQLETNARGALYRAADRAQLEQSMSGLDAPSADLEARRRSLDARLGFAAPQPDADLVDMLRGLDAARSARAEARSSAAKRDELQRSWQRRLEEIGVYLDTLGEARPRDSAAARAAVRSLEARDRTLRVALADALRAEQSLERLGPEIEELETETAALFRRAGVEADDKLSLTRQLESLGRYREGVRGREGLTSGIARETESLAADGEGELARCDLAQLREARAALEEESAQLESLNRQIGEISQSARSAREGHLLEDAIASRGDALASLRDRRDEALAAAAAGFLVDRVRQEHETNQMPLVLERARNRFASFTHHRYQLKVSANEGGSFVAVDADNGAGLTADQLSDGTRAQLILAARLAFAEEAERGAALPLFLDEALDHSDPARFHAIARSLARMVADDGRQIFYLSNDPTDVARLRQAFAEEGCDQIETIDLAELLGRAAAVDGPEALRVAPRAPVPSPAGESAESYGEAIAVAALAPDCDPFGQPLYYLLRDDLELLHRLLRARIETVGQCRNLLRGGSEFAREIVAGSGLGPQLEARIALLETFCLAFREGRGKRLGRLELERSGALSQTYLDAVTEIAAECEGDAARLLAALRERKDPRLRGFRSKSTEDLERFFVETGHVDDKPILGEAQIVDRAIGTPAAHQLTPETAADLVYQWWILSARRRVDS